VSSSIGHRVGFSVREPGPAAPDIDPEEYYALLANAADFVVERLGADVVFFPMERADIRHSHAVVSPYEERGVQRDPEATVLADADPDLIGRFEFVVDMRLHFLNFAALRETPFTRASLRIEGNRPP
jgi:hypothetical protein